MCRFIRSIVQNNRTKRHMSKDGYAAIRICRKNNSKPTHYMWQLRRTIFSRPCWCWCCLAGKINKNSLMTFTVINWSFIPNVICWSMMLNVTGYWCSFVSVVMYERFFLRKVRKKSQYQIAIFPDETSWQQKKILFLALDDNVINTFVCNRY